MNNLRCPLCNENVVDSKYSQKNNMIFKCRSCLLHFVKKEYSLDEILELPDVKERIELYRQHEKIFKECLSKL